jgi:hypothetical protein
LNSPQGFANLMSTMWPELINMKEQMGELMPKVMDHLIPHYIVQVELRKHNPWISGIITTSVLIGGFAMRCIVIYACQMAPVIS